MNKAAQELGRLGGSAKSESKSKANRRIIKQFWADVRSGIKPPPHRIYKCKSLSERFWMKVKKGTQKECWNWTASTDGGGYGKIGSGSRRAKTLKTLRASVVSWRLHFGAIPKGAYVCHTCDNPLCVNPEHLYLGDSKTNMDDRVNRGRMPVGSALPQAILNEEQVREIKRTNGVVRFSASPATVSHILAGRQWKHVTA